MSGAGQGAAAGRLPWALRPLAGQRGASPPPVSRHIPAARLAFSLSFVALRRCLSARGMRPHAHSIEYSLARPCTRSLALVTRPRARSLLPRPRCFPHIPPPPTNPPERCYRVFPAALPCLLHSLAAVPQVSGVGSGCRRRRVCFQVSPAGATGADDALRARARARVCHKCVCVCVCVPIRNVIIRGADRHTAAAPPFLIHYTTHTLRSEVEGDLER